MSRVLKSRMRSNAVVTLKDGQSFGGVLWEHDSSALVLRNCAALGAGEKRTNMPIDGELVILWPDVAHIQRL